MKFFALFFLLLVTFAMVSCKTTKRKTTTRRIKKTTRACPQICPLNYAPVCGQSLSSREYNTFGNKCAFNAANCPKVRKCPIHFFN